MLYTYTEWTLFYYMTKEYCPILYLKLPFSMGQDFLDLQYVPRSLDQYYIATYCMSKKNRTISYCIKWVTTSRTYSTVGSNHNPMSISFNLRWMHGKQDQHETCRFQIDSVFSQYYIQQMRVHVESVLTAHWPTYSKSPYDCRKTQYQLTIERTFLCQKNNLSTKNAQIFVILK